MQITIEEEGFREEGLGSRLSALKHADTNFKFKSVQGRATSEFALQIAYWKSWTRPWRWLLYFKFGHVAIAMGQSSTMCMYV